MSETIERAARILFRQARGVKCPPASGAWRDYEADAKELVGGHDGALDVKLRELIDQWKSEAAKHKKASEADDSEPGSDEWLLHREAARIFARCADELALAVHRF